MSVFNSLGSNYGSGAIIRALFGGGMDVDLAQMLKQKFGGSALITYKGREALAQGLKVLNLPPGSAIAITGYTCFAVYQAVVSAGFEVEYLDIDPETLNFKAATLKSAVKRCPNIKAVIVQNTLGFPCDIASIAKVCQQNKLKLIEDLAHSVGAAYSDGTEAGKVGDVVMLSFGRDKVVDAVSGGALVVRGPKLSLPEANLPQAPPAPRLRDRIYPLLALKIRVAYSIGIGKYVHAMFKAVGLLSRSVDGEFYSGHQLPGWNAQLAAARLKNLGEELDHRREIAEVYAQNLDNSVMYPELISLIPRSANLRFPIRIKDRPGLIDFMAERGFYIADTWYDAVIAPPRYLQKASYNGQCPMADKTATQMINLPTHTQVNAKAATKISNLINQWLQSQ